MKNKIWFLIIMMVLLLSMFSVSGCGVAQSDYDTLLAQKNALENEKAELQADYDALQTDYDSTLDTYTIMSNDYDEVKAELDELNTDYQDLMTQKNALASDIAVLQAEYDTVNVQLDDIMDVYPPGDFPSRRTLEDWLLANDVSTKPVTTTAEAWIGRALEIQEDALKDGYIINVDYDYDEVSQMFFVYCTAVINGNIWWWDPETDDIYQDTTLEAVK